MLSKTLSFWLVIITVCLLFTFKQLQLSDTGFMMGVMIIIIVLGIITYTFQEAVSQETTMREAAIVETNWQDDSPEHIDNDILRFAQKVKQQCYWSPQNYQAMVSCLNKFCKLYFNIKQHPITYLTAKYYASNLRDLQQQALSYLFNFGLSIEGRPEQLVIIDTFASELNKLLAQKIFAIIQNYPDLVSINNEVVQASNYFADGTLNE